MLRHALCVWMFFVMGAIPLLSSEQPNDATFLPVPAGEAIIGDPFKEGDRDETPSWKAQIDSFSIGAYEVTNSQYAAWLTAALKAGKVIYHFSGDNVGIVTSKNGNVLFKTVDADIDSQIIAVKRGLQGVVFAPTPGKNRFPVIDVTWYGAVAYCEDNGCRLPTEAEWEKAAGMALSEPGKPPRKYRYGFASDTIDRSWANYKDNDSEITHIKVLTTEVGFYNGKHVLPLRQGDLKQLHSRDARSPCGAYDMSGNVWEWVADWYSSDYYKKAQGANPKGPSFGNEKVAKGGCYDSLADGVRVAERLPMPPDHADVYTGFRVAK